jgi:hypothetical protein
MPYTTCLAHGMLGPIDELLPLVVAGLFVVLLLISLVVQRRQAQSLSSDNFPEPDPPLVKIGRNGEYENVTRVCLD